MDLSETTRELLGISNDRHFKHDIYMDLKTWNALGKKDFFLIGLQKTIK